MRERRAHYVLRRQIRAALFDQIARDVELATVTRVVQSGVSDLHTSRQERGEEKRGESEERGEQGRERAGTHTHDTQTTTDVSTHAAFACVVARRAVPRPRAQRCVVRERREREREGEKRERERERAHCPSPSDPRRALRPDSARGRGCHCNTPSAKRWLRTTHQSAREERGGERRGRGEGRARPREQAHTRHTQTSAQIRTRVHDRNPSRQRRQRPDEGNEGKEAAAPHPIILLHARARVEQPLHLRNVALICRFVDLPHTVHTRSLTDWRLDIRAHTHAAQSTQPPPRARQKESQSAHTRGSARFASHTHTRPLGPRSQAIHHRADRTRCPPRTAPSRPAPYPPRQLRASHLPTAQQQQQEQHA